MVTSNPERKEIRPEYGNEVQDIIREMKKPKRIRRAVNPEVECAR